MKRSPSTRILSFLLSVILMVSSIGSFAALGSEENTKGSEVWIKLSRQSGLPGEAPAENQEAETGEDDTEELSKKLRPLYLLHLGCTLQNPVFSEEQQIVCNKLRTSHTPSTLYIRYCKLII